MQSTCLKHVRVPRQRLGKLFSSLVQSYQFAKHALPHAHGFRKQQIPIRKATAAEMRDALFSEPKKKFSTFLSIYFGAVASFCKDVATEDVRSPELSNFVAPGRTSTPNLSSNLLHFLCAPSRIVLPSSGHDRYQREDFQRPRRRARVARVCSRFW